MLKTRLAPTPSGFLHKGNLFSFALTHCLAKEKNAGLLLRIDDMDAARCRDAYIGDIFYWMKQLHLHYSEGPKTLVEFKKIWSQQTRMKQYLHLRNELIEANAVFACVCSRNVPRPQCTCKQKAFPFTQPDAALRISVEPGTVVQWKDERLGEQLVTLHALMPDFVVWKKDGNPSYHLCSLADDLHFGINYIVRGEDLLPSTAAQLYMAGLLNKTGFSNALFHHHPLMMHKGRKLSKSAGDSLQYNHQPFETAEVLAIINDSLANAGYHFRIAI